MNGQETRLGIDSQKHFFPQGLSGKEAYMSGEEYNSQDADVNGAGKLNGPLSRDDIEGAEQE